MLNQMSYDSQQEKNCSQLMYDFYDQYSMHWMKQHPRNKKEYQQRQKKPVRQLNRTLFLLQFANPFADMHHRQNNQEQPQNGMPDASRQPLKKKQYT